MYHKNFRVYSTIFKKETKQQWALSESLDELQNHICLAPNNYQLLIFCLKV